MVKFNDYVKASDIWATAKDYEDYGERFGLLRGYNVEIRKGDATDWLSAEWIYGDPNKIFNDEYHTWRNETHGFEYTGRICFRGYGTEEYDDEERDFYVVQVEDDEEIPDEPIDIDDDMGFDPYAGCYTYDC